jgi:hypothetical protein
MYICRIRHINDPVLSLLKMEGIRLLFLSHATIIIRNKLSFLYVCPQYRHTQLSKHTAIHTTVDGKAHYM